MDGPGVTPKVDESAGRLVFHYCDRPYENTIDELLAGLSEPIPRIAPKFFYDTRGAELFDAITRLPEYYLTRAEHEIFCTHRRSIAEAVGAGRVIIEPGSGSSEKVELLFDALMPSSYVPVEITESHLVAAAQRISGRYPWLDVHAVCADYSQGLPLPRELPGSARLVFFPGSTIGNFEPAEAISFLCHLNRACGVGGRLLIGVDLRKEPDILHAAYNDAAGVTARFNLNVLDHVNRISGSDFDPAGFRHVAFFNDVQSRVEMHLESLRRQTVTLNGSQRLFETGERIHTENSYKYSQEHFLDLAQRAGFKARARWLDSEGLFAVHLLDSV